jgi:hypothetical protein
MKALLIFLCLITAGTAAAQSEPAVTEGRVSPSSAEPGARFRLGLQLAGGGFFPDGAPASGLAVRVGVQLGRVGLLVEAGGFGGLLRSVDDPAASRVSGLALGHVTPMVEFDLTDRAFVGAGAIFGGGIMFQTKHGIDPLGSVRSESTNMMGEGLMNFAAGADVRGGWRFGSGPHRLALGLDFKLMLADGHVASALISPGGEIDARDVRQAIWTLTPTVFLAWEFAR